MSRDDEKPGRYAQWFERYYSEVEGIPDKAKGIIRNAANRLDDEAKELAVLEERVRQQKRWQDEGEARSADLLQKRVALMRANGVLIWHDGANHIELQPVPR